MLQLAICKGVKREQHSRLSGVVVGNCNIAGLIYCLHKYIWIILGPRENKRDGISCNLIPFEASVMHFVLYSYNSFTEHSSVSVKLAI